MEMTLEGSNSAETFPPWDGVAGLHRPVTGTLAAWLDNYISLFFLLFSFLFPSPPSLLQRPNTTTMPSNPKVQKDNFLPHNSAKMYPATMIMQCHLIALSPGCATAVWRVSIVKRSNSDAGAYVPTCYLGYLLSWISPTEYGHLRNFPDMTNLALIAISDS
ncbi:hypothetical protein BJX96DRAFT_135327 [Aspergillus floccosus]